MAAVKSPISRLQEICHQWKLSIPTYSVGQGNFSLFGTEVSVNIADEVVQFNALGRSKRESKNNAAQKVLEFIQQDYPQFLEPSSTSRINPGMSSGSVFVKTDQSNKQKEPVKRDQLAPEGEQLGDIQVGLDLGLVVQQARHKVGLMQRDLAAKINERPALISAIEQGKLIPDQRIICKLERALGVHLRTEKTALPTS